MQREISLDTQNTCLYNKNEVKKMKIQVCHEYDDIIQLPHHQSSMRPHMSMQDRAAQFGAFAALTGHEAAVQETADAARERMEFRDVEEIDEV